MSKRSEIFTKIYLSLQSKGEISSRTDLAERIGVSNDTLTRIMKHGSNVSDLTFQKLDDEFPGCVDWDEVMGIKKPESATANPDEQRAMIIDLYAQLIKEVESMRRSLADELTAVRELRTDLASQVNRLSHLMSGYAVSASLDTTKAAESKTQTI